MSKFRVAKEKLVKTSVAKTKFALSSLKRAPVPLPPAVAAVLLATGDGFVSAPAPPPRGPGLRPGPREPAPAPPLLHRRAGVAGAADIARGAGARAHDGGLRPGRSSEPFGV